MKILFGRICSRCVFEVAGALICHRRKARELQFRTHVSPMSRRQRVGPLRLVDTQKRTVRIKFPDAGGEGAGKGAAGVVRFQRVGGGSVVNAHSALTQR